MPSAVRYHEVTLYILRSLTKLQLDVPLEERQLKIEFIEPLNQVWKGITNAKSELVKLSEYKEFVNYRLNGVRDYKAGEITFSLSTYMKDMSRVKF